MFILLAMIFLGLTLSPSFSETENLDMVPNSYIIILRQEERTEGFSAQSRMMSVSEVQEDFLSTHHKENFTITHQYEKFPIIVIESNENTIEKIMNNPHVESVSPNILLHTMIHNVTEIIESTNYIYYTSYNGTGQTVCVLDTGVDYTHSSLGGGWGNIVIAGARISNGRVTECTEADPVPCKDTHSHGTHVAGTIASQHETYGGVAPGAKIAAVNVMPGGTGSIADIIKGIEWCISNSEEHGITVISMSLGRKNYLTDSVVECEENPNNKPFVSPINTAVEAGIFVVAASGNNGHPTKISSPACIENVIAVGSTTKTDSISTFSNRGALMDLMAPGTSIVSTVLNNNFGTKSGTSMATPAVSGAIVLLNENRDLNRTEIIELLNKTKDRIIENEFNYPRINLMDSAYCLCSSCEECSSKLNDSLCTDVRINQNISSMGTCINITGLIYKSINCQNHKIEYADKETGNAIYIQHSENIQIKNCMLEKTSTVNGTNSNNSVYAVILNHTNNIRKENVDFLVNGEYGGGILFSGTNTDTHLSNLSLFSTHNYSHGINVFSGNNTFEIFDSVINSTKGKDLMISNTSESGEFNFTNTHRFDTFNINKNWELGGNGTLNVFWYVDVYVNNTEGEPMEGISINISDNEELKFSGKTNAQGRIPTQHFIEYTQVNGTEENYFSNYTLNATLGNILEEKKINLTETKNIFFTFNPVFLKINSTPGGDATLPGEGDFIYTKETFLELVAETEEGYTFLGWIGDTAGINNTSLAETNITLSENYNITAVFSYSLTITSTRGGDLIEPQEEKTYHPNGTVVNLTASENSGYRFKGWTGDIETIENPDKLDTKIAMLDDYEIIANFERIVTGGGGGGGSAPREPEPESELIEWTEEEKLDVSMKVNDELKFYIDDNEHTVTLTEVGVNYARLSIHSEPILLTMYLGQTREVDITGDGNNNIRIYLEKIENGEAHFEFERLEVEDFPIEEETKEESVDLIEEPHETTEKFEELPLKIPVLVLIIFIIGMIGILFYLKIKPTKLRSK